MVEGCKRPEEFAHAYYTIHRIIQVFKRPIPQPFALQELARIQIPDYSAIITSNLQALKCNFCKYTDFGGERLVFLPIDPA